MPTGGHYNLYRSARGGAQIDFVDGKLNALPIPATPPRPADGFGGGGFGRQSFGAGVHQFITGPLEDGDYLFCVCPADAAGNENRADLALATLTLAQRPLASERAGLGGYDGQTETLSVEWERSTDDR
jgi:hypothetical protein